MIYDVAIIGGGPSGLAAAIGAAAEGLSVVVLCDRLGGQAGTSSAIENFLGFPEGISGPDLADRAKRQALKFGTNFVDTACLSVIRDGPLFRLHTHDGVMEARRVIVASGARYRRLDPSTGFEKFEGKGVHYAATQQEVRQSCKCDTVVVIGGGNSAGQAASFLASKAKNVHLLIRGKGLRHTMSGYLIDRLETLPNVTCHYETEAVAFDGDGWLERVTLKCNDGSTKQLDATDVYVMIGADPNTEFLTGACALDKDGFIETDDFFRTKMDGLYAVGDVRSGSTKRVANAVGEGSTVIKWVWRDLFPEEKAA